MTAVGLALLVILFPDSVFQAGLHGLRIWWNYVFPATLPYLILTELLLGLGALHALGQLLQPAMRLLFRISGNAGWAAAVGIAAGYPAGAAAAAKLHRERLIGRAETERLLAFAHVCNPVVVITVIGAVFLNNTAAGTAIALIHYAAAGITGLLARFWIPDDGAEPFGEPSAARSAKKPAAPQPGLARRMYRAMAEARSRDGRAFGKLLGDAVSASLQTLLLIGGFIILFSVLVRLILLLLPAAPPALAALLPGLFEHHYGAFAAGRSEALPPVLAAAWIGAWLGWSGLSQHAQIRGLLAGTSVRYAPFLLARAVHGTTAFLLTLLVWNPLGGLLVRAEPSFSALAGAAAPPAAGWGALALAPLGSIALSLAAMAVFSWLIRKLAVR